MDFNILQRPVGAGIIRAGFGATPRFAEPAQVLLNRFALAAEVPRSSPFGEGPGFVETLRDPLSESADVSTAMTRLVAFMRSQQANDTTLTARERLQTAQVISAVKQTDTWAVRVRLVSEAGTQDTTDLSG